MAGVLVANGELAAALECAKAAAENGPEFAPAHVNLGFVYFQNGDPARALAENLVALRLDPALPNRPAVIEILRGYRPDDPAVELLCGVLEADMARLPGSQPNTYVLDRPSGTVTAWPDLVAMLPDDPLLLCRLGQSLQGAGLLEEALSTLRRGHALGLKTEGWSEPSATWVAECERALAARTSESGRR